MCVSPSFDSRSREVSNHRSERECVTVAGHRADDYSRVYVWWHADASALRLVCSDLISRGIDISHVSHVVSYDVPVDFRKYVHRAGRTARAGRAGDAWTLVEEQEVRARPRSRVVEKEAKREC